MQFQHDRSATTTSPYRINTFKELKLRLSCVKSTVNIFDDANKMPRHLTDSANCMGLSDMYIE